jgi:hypothetical protein
MNTGEPENSPWRNFVWLGAFAAAMGILEAIVVVYLRELYHPTGFQFPMQPVPQRTLMIEILREVCTIVMLASVAGAVHRNRALRIASFLFTFGLWDVFYYLGLKLLLNWPPSLFTWDILFLIPVAWTAPVLAPLISSFTFIAIGLLLTSLQKRYQIVRTGALAWTLMGTGVFFIFLTFIGDHAKIIIEGGFFSAVLGVERGPAFQAAVSAYVPTSFHWLLFVLGEAMIVAGAIVVYKETRGERPR